MKYRKLINNDYAFGQSQANFWIDVPEAPAQLVLTSLRLWTGEWFLDRTIGLPYLTSVLQNTSSDEYDFVFRTAMLSTQGITSIVSYQSIYSGVPRSLTINATLTTLYGQTPISLTI